VTSDPSEHYRGTDTPVARLPSCSVVVSTRDRPGPLPPASSPCAARRPRTTRSSSWTALRVAKAAESVADRFGARYLRVERPGLSRARNRGADAASGEVVVFLDDDVTLDSGCIASLLEEFADPLTAAVGGRIVLDDGDPAAREAFESFGGFDPGPERRAIDRQTPDWFELTNFGGLGSGAMLAIRRAAFDAWPGFDERLGRGAPLDAGEEMHAYFSLVERGYRAVYTPGRSLATRRRRPWRSCASACWVAPRSARLTS
jgi:glycosyltransferase involved in cell wall biosynthesis